MNRATTPVLESYEAQTHHPTPTRAKIQGAVEFCDAMKISYFKEDVFRVFGTSKQTGWKVLTRENSSRIRHNADISETRGRHSIVTGMEARGLTWAQLGYEVRLKCSGRTIQRVMGTTNYHKCIACRKGYRHERKIS